MRKLKKKYIEVFAFTKNVIDMELIAAGISLPMPQAATSKLLEQLESEPATTTGDGIKSATNPKFTPGGEAEKLIPKESDFISFPFRALSATTVAAYTYRATEFPEAVLRESVSLLNGQTAFQNHWADTSGSIGMSEESSWGERTTQNGVVIPAGINTNIKVDTTINKQIARKMLTGEICCVSVKVKFEWRPSHQFSKEWEFHEQLGEMQPDGTMCRRIATKILQYQEISVVNVGADPYAGMIDGEGMLRKIDNTQVYNVEGFSATETEKPTAENQVGQNICVVGLTKETLLLTKKQKPDPEDKGEGEEKTKAMTAELIAKYEGEKNALVEKLKAGEESLATKIVEISQLSAKLTTATEELAKKTAELEAAKISAEKWELHLTEKKTAVVDLYKKASESPSEAIISLIEKSNETELVALEKEYVKKAEQLFSFKCKKCESTEYSLQSSTTEKANSKGNENKRSVPAFAEPEIHEVK